MGQQPEQHPSLSDQAEAVQDGADLLARCGSILACGITSFGAHPPDLSYVINRISLLTRSSGEHRLG